MFHSCICFAFVFEDAECISMYLNVTIFFCGLLRPFFGATQANSLRLCQGFQKRMLNKQNE